MNKYVINNIVKTDIKYDYLDKVIKRTLKVEKVKKAFLEISLVDKKMIQDINREYRGIDKVTDVISFAFEDNLEQIQMDERFLGEIYICVPKMVEQAEEYGHSVKRELSFLTVHGLLHLLGYDHQSKEEEDVMFGLQELILNEENIKS